MLYKSLFYPPWNEEEAGIVKLDSPLPGTPEVPNWFRRGPWAMFVDGLRLIGLYSC